MYGPCHCSGLCVAPSSVTNKPAITLRIGTSFPSLDSSPRRAPHAASLVAPAAHRKVDDPKKNRRIWIALAGVHPCGRRLRAPRIGVTKEYGSSWIFESCLTCANALWRVQHPGFSLVVTVTPPAAECGRTDRFDGVARNLNACAHPQSDRCRPRERDERRDEVPDARPVLARPHCQDESGRRREDRVRGPTSLAVGDAAPREYERGERQSSDRDGEADTVQDRARAEFLRRTRRRTRRESERWVGPEDASRDEAKPEQAGEQRHPAGGAIFESAPESDCERADQHPTEDEGRRLDPAEVAQGEQAERVLREVVPVARERLDHDDGDEQRTRERTAG